MAYHPTAMNPLRLLAAVGILVMISCRTTAPPDVLVEPPAYDLQPWLDRAREVMRRPDVEHAMSFVASDRETIVRQWVAINEIPAPSGHEAARADRVIELLRGSGLEIERDAAGNVIATRRGSGGGRHVVFDAHLDTVFPLTTDVKTRVEADRIHGPGVGDNTRNVVALLAMIRAMEAGGVETAGDITFLFSVEEETTFRGIRKFLGDRGTTVDAFVALDGGHEDFTYGGIGIYWDRYYVAGPGGHTRSPSPPVSATLAVARAIDRIYALPMPGYAWVNVGMLGAGDVFNAKASEAWMSVDLRSSDAATLHRLDGEVEAIVHEEAAKLGMTARRENVSRSEVARLEGHRTSPMVLATEAVWRTFGFDPRITATASNHASVVLLAGIPAISTGVAPCSHAHAQNESCAIEPAVTGIQRNIALAVMLSQPHSY
jgi:tripeptide aminopeptidase